MERKYQRTHPWITFEINLKEDLNYKTWQLLGEASSKCSHIGGAPLLPDVAKELHTVYLSRGIFGTTAIEGNTLSEEEVRERIEGELRLPKSREYQGHEVDNILGITNEIVRDLMENPGMPVTADRMRDFNKRVLDGLPVKDSVIPGMTRQHSVTVGINDYRGAPAEDCDYLLDRLATWLNDLKAPADNPELVFPIAVLKAILAHLYIAWIHPFGDGNGRTARLIELQLMVQAGISTPAAHLLSNHYNLTRDRYLVELDRTSTRQGYPISEFIHYALEGFVDQLREQIETIRGQQFLVTWQHLVHTSYRDEETPAKVRQRHLVLDLKPNTWYHRSKIREVSPRVAVEYTGKESKTVTRDLNELERRGLIIRRGPQFMANYQEVMAFLPAVVPPVAD
ncbi:MAG: Fic family protein [Actinomycetota bacterium]